MANGDLLSEIDTSAISQFKKDFMQMMKVGAEIDRYWGEAQRDLDTFIPKFEKLVEQFNKKYKGIKIKAIKSLESYNVRIFIKSRDIKEFFAQSASMIPGLRAIGRAAFNQVDVNDVEKFARFLDTIMDKIFITYADTESGTSTLAAALNRQQKMIELAYNLPEVLNENSAIFKVCAFYALKDGFDKNIEIYGNSSTFGFFSLLNEIEKREWYDKFNPRYLE